MVAAVVGGIWNNDPVIGQTQTHDVFSTFSTCVGAPVGLEETGKVAGC